MPYMLAPGARLYVGPRGQMEESLGACCAPCAQGRPCASLGAVDKSGNVIKAPPVDKTGNAIRFKTMENFRGSLISAGPQFTAQADSILPYVLGGAVLLVGGALILRRNRKR